MSQQKNQPFRRRNVMNTIQRACEASAPRDLQQIIEPLASYICATEQPKTALKSALAVLFREVEATNRAATAHFRATLAV
jgi:hypothetical protein